MTRGTEDQHAGLFLQDGFSKLRRHDDSMDVKGSGEGHSRQPVWIEPATGPERLTKEEAQRPAEENFLPRVDQEAEAEVAGMTVSAFVENAFVPEHVVNKGAAGRTHYQAMLKHVIGPERVERVFGVAGNSSRARLKAIPDWPYLGGMRLGDVHQAHIQSLVSAASARGYSPQTVTHIVRVVFNIFEHARKKRWFTADNPANGVTLPMMARKEAHVLTLGQATELFRLMQYPEREIALFLILTNMNVAEICGLQWKCVNLTEAGCSHDGEPIPPRTIAVKKQLDGGAVRNLEKQSRYRNLPIPTPLLPMLLRLSRRSAFVGPEDYVLVARVGAPVNAKNLVPRRLKPIGSALQMPWLSWHVFQRTHKTLPYDLGLAVMSFCEPDTSDRRTLLSSSGR